MCGFIRSDEYGGNGGQAFADDLTETCQLVEVIIRSGDRIDSIQGVWLTPSGSRISGAVHGGRGGRLASFTLEPGEVITRVDGRWGAGAGARRARPVTRGSASAAAGYP